VWHSGRAEQLHALLVTDDVVSGVRHTQSPSCDSCRIQIPRAEVDSIRFGNPTAGFWKSVGLVIGTTLVLMGVACAAEGGCPTND